MLHTANNRGGPAFQMRPESSSCGCPTRISPLLSQPQQPALFLQPPALHTARRHHRQQVAAASSTRSPAPVPPRAAFQQAKADRWGRGSVAEVKSKPGSKRGKPGGDEEEEEKWGVLDFSRFEGWEVPWSGASVAGGMALWFGSFVAVGFLVVPGLYGAAGAWSNACVVFVCMLDPYMDLLPPVTLVQ